MTTFTERDGFDIVDRDMLVADESATELAGEAGGRGKTGLGGGEGSVGCGSEDFEEDVEAMEMEDALEQKPSGNVLEREEAVDEAGDGLLLFGRYVE